MVLKTTYGLSFSCRQYTMMIAKKTAPKWCKCKRGVEKLIEFKSLCVVFSWALYTTVDDADTSFSCCNVSLSAITKAVKITITQSDNIRELYHDHE